MSVERARRLRRDSTDAERRLWSRLRRTVLDGHSFRRQQPIGPYIVDLVCVARRLVVEIDGGQHDGQSTSDERRSAWLHAQGFRVLRFWNNDVLQNTEGVLEAIRAALKDDMDLS